MTNKLFTIYVTTRASRRSVTPQPDGSLKVRLTSAPVDGHANDELIKILADYLDVAKSKVTIIRGLKNKMKLVRIDKS